MIYVYFLYIFLLFDYSGRELIIKPNMCQHYYFDYIILLIVCPGNMEDWKSTLIDEEEMMIDDDDR